MNILGNPKSRVQHMNLSCNKIRDDGLQQLAQAMTSSIRNRNFWFIDLGCNCPSPMGISALCAAMPNVRSLQAIDLCTMGLVEQDALTLIAALNHPECSIRNVIYYNNPLIADVEGALESAIAAKEELCQRRAKDEARWCRSLSYAAITAAALSVICYRLFRSGRHYCAELTWRNV